MNVLSFSLSIFIILSTNFLLGQDQEPTEIVKGKIIQKKSFNKAGRELPGDGDFFLKYKGEELFVKITEGKVTTEELHQNLNTKRKFEVRFSQGLWDTDDPNVQSRIGKYVVIMEVKPK